MAENIGLVFIHGAGLGSFIWSELRPMINHPVLFIDLPNREADSDANRSLVFEDYLKSIIHQIEKWNKDKIVLVAHSIGGCLGIKLIDHFARRVTGFVGISAAIPKKGKSFISCLPFPQKLLMPLILGMLGTKPPQKLIETDLCNDLTNEQSLEIVNRFTPEAKSLYTTKVSYKTRPTRNLYVMLTNDKAFPIPVQGKMIKNLNAQTIVELESGHLPMISKPKELAKILNDFMSNQ
ncbi:MAG: alpha/beta fold hydrolase [Cyclobacteriaceae bacterium]